MCTFISYLRVTMSNMGNSNETIQILSPFVIIDILFGGSSREGDELLELRFGANEWNVLPQKLNQPRGGHVVIPIP